MTDILTLSTEKTVGQEQCNISAELFYFYTVQQIKLAVCYKFENQLSKQSILPCKPLSRKFGRIILMEGLMHKACTGICRHKRFYTPLDFLVTL